LGQPVSLQELFAYPSIAALAAHLDAGAVSAGAAAVEQRDDQRVAGNARRQQRLRQRQGRAAEAEVEDA